MVEPPDTPPRREAIAAPAAVLLEVHGLDPGRQVGLRDGAVLLGRSSKCDLRIDQATVSRTHARLSASAGTWVIEDLGSTHGTWLDTIPVHRAVLAHGDRLRLGHTVLWFLTDPPLEATLQQAIHRLVIRDGLTDLLNRGAFMEIAEREVARARRHYRPLSLVRLRVDTPPGLGEVEAELAFEVAARRAAREARVEDVLGRWESRSFVALLPETGAAGAHVMGARLAGRIARPLPWSPDAAAVSVEAATTTLGPDTGAAEDLLQGLDA